MENDIALNEKCALKKAQILNGATLKLLACAIMLIDHIGFIFLQNGAPAYTVLRAIGRVAFPIFAFFIAEGCKYTKNKFRHFALILFAGVTCEAFIVAFTKQFIGNIFLTFSVSIALVYLLENVKRSIFEKRVFDAIIGLGTFITAIVALIFAFNLTITSPLLSLPQKFTLDYGLYGILAPVAVSLFDFSRIESTPTALKKLDCPPIKLLSLSLILIPLALSQPKDYVTLQLFQYIAIPLLLLYNGKKGFNIKYSFYLFYPLHMVILYGIKIFM